MNEKQTLPASDTETIRPTKRQQGLLEFIDAFIKEHGYSPSYREIMAGLNYTSVATVALHVNNLIRRGHLRKRDRSARSLELTKPLVDSPMMPAVIKTNDIKPSEEKWLIEKISYMFDKADSEAIVPTEAVRDLETLIAALEILGLAPAAQQFKQRLNTMLTAT